VDVLKPTRSAPCTRAAIVLVLAIPLALTACQSTQDKSARLARSGKGLLAEKGLAVHAESKDVKVVSTDVLRDENGTAAVVALRNASRRELAQVPVAIDVRGAARKSVFRNEQPGLEPTLAHVPLIRGEQRLFWVNDQVSPTARPRSVTARVGRAAAVDAKRIPRIAVSGARLVTDAVSGIAAEGLVANHSKVDQRKLVIFAVARRGGRIVAAGRAQVARLKPGKRARFQVFFIGDPSGAKLELAAPPTTLAKG
jgi:hypothetical protein